VARLKSPALAALFEAGDCQTPLDPDDAEGLLLDIDTRRELNDARELHPPSRANPLLFQRNGRHARALTDLVMPKFGRPHFEWGASLGAASRTQYIASLRAAGAGDFEGLIEFVRR